MANEFPSAVGEDVEPRPDELTHQAEANLRRLVLAFRLLGWLWMLLLVIATLATDDEANRTITVAAMVLATVWTGVTWWAARHRSILGSAWFVIADGAVCLIIAAASYAADAGDLFHGGFPISWIAVAAYGGGLAWALPASFVLMAQQAVLHLQSGRSAVAAAGSIVFVVYAVILGSLISIVRNSDRERRRTATKLTAEREENARRQERLELANRLHDSALQTLQVIGSDAEDPDRVRSLARRQSRELRGLVDSYSTDGATVRSELRRIAGDIESLRGVEVSVVVRTDRSVDATGRALLEASREAMTNAAKHADVERIDVYAAEAADTLEIHIRDTGLGFDDSDGAGYGVEHSIRQRVEAVGGVAAITSEAGRGTEVTLTAPIEGER